MKTALGRRLSEIRARIIASGARLLPWNGIDLELHPAREPTCPNWKHSGDPVLEAHYYRERCYLAERIIREVLTGKQIGRAHHMADLEDRVKTLRREVRIKQEAAERRNLKLRATNMIVGCTAACTDATFEDAGVIDEAFVAEVERIATRLRSWFNNWEARKRND